MQSSPELHESQRRGFKTRKMPKTIKKCLKFFRLAKTLSSSSARRIVATQFLIFQLFWISDFPTLLDFSEFLIFQLFPYNHVISYKKSIFFTKNIVFNLFLKKLTVFEILIKFVILQQFNIIHQFYTISTLTKRDFPKSHLIT